MLECIYIYIYIYTHFDIKIVMNTRSLIIEGNLFLLNKKDSPDAISKI